MAKKLSSVEQRAGSKVLDELRAHAKGMMNDKMKGLKKVTVASNTSEGLKSGLSKAEEILKGKNPVSSDLLEPEEELEKQTEDESPEHEASESEDFEAGEQEGMDEECNTPEEIDAKIKELMALKSQMLAKK